MSKLPQSLAFFLQVPQGLQAFANITVFGSPTPDYSFLSGIRLTAGTSAPHPVRAVCDGKAKLVPPTTIRLEPDAPYQINPMCRVTAFVYRVGPPRAELISADIDARPLRKSNDNTLQSRILSGHGNEFIKVDKGVTLCDTAQLDWDVETDAPIEPYPLVVEAVTPIEPNPSKPQPNLYDPAAFWKWALTLGLVDPAEQQHLSSWLSTAFPGHYVIELRNERNAPVTPPPQAAGRKSAPEAGITVGSGIRQTAGSLRRGVIVTQSTPGTSVVVDAIGAAGEHLDSPDTQYAFWDSISGRWSITSKVIQLPDSPAHIVVQAVRPSEWFAPQAAQADDATTFVPLSRFTSQNAVTALIDSFEYWTDLAAELDKIDRNATDQWWHVTGWSFDSDLSLRPVERGHRLRDYLTRHSAQGQLVYMPWVSIPLLLGVYEANRRSQIYVAASRVSYDDRGWPLAIHMKVSVVRNTDGLCGYCGGMDLWSDRCLSSESDTACLLNTPNSDFNAHAAAGGEWGQHDVQLKVRGPAASELDRVLQHRWLDKEKPAAAFQTFVDASAPGDAFVQVARTAPALSFPPLKFAREGDTTLGDTLLRAIGKATRYIYIEDQYFTSEVIKDALVRALGRNIELLLVIMPRFSFGPLTGHNASEVFAGTDSQRSVAKDLRDAGGDRALFATLANRRNSDVYVHAKVQIIDDCFVSCGSANLDSLGVPSPGVSVVSQECNLMVMGGGLPAAGRTLAKELRLRLWAEHLGCPPDMVEKDLSEGISKWKALYEKFRHPEAAADGNARDGGMNVRFADRHLGLI